MATEKLKLTFCSGAGTVTGSNFLVERIGHSDQSFLVDCGLVQGTREQEKMNLDPFPYDPKEIGALFITHAHLDHIGRIPRLVKQGFRGKIYSTPPTRDIAEVSLKGRLQVLEKGLAGFTGEEPFYTEEDISEAMALWQAVDYHEPINYGDYNIILRDSGHILGSAMIEVNWRNKKLVFTGDLGNSPAPLLKDTEKISDANYLVMESVYGDRNHEDRSARREKLEKVIEDTVRSGGTLMIPAFSIERTQELLFEIENMMENSRIPLVPVFLDSPLAIAVTEVYKKYVNYFNKEATNIRLNGDGLFKFPQLHFTESTEDSKRIFNSSPSKIILAGSGMSNGGRIIHHEKNYLPDSKSTLLLAGYQSVGSLGRILQDGAKLVRILGEEVPVRAKVVGISGYSAHKDSEHLLEFVQNSIDHLDKVFVCMGEPKASLFLVQRIRDYLGVGALAPQAGASYELNF